VLHLLRQRVLEALARDGAGGADGLSGGDGVVVPPRGEEQVGVSADAGAVVHPADVGDNLSAHHPTPFLEGRRAGRRCRGLVSRSISPRRSAMTRSRWATLSSRSPMTRRSIRRRAARARPRRRESRAWWSRSAHTSRVRNALALARSSAAMS